jgi:hypothetical protein
MKPIITMFLIGASIVGASRTSDKLQDKEIAQEICRFYGLNYGKPTWRKQALPLLKREFLRYAFVYPIGYRQSWSPIASDADLVDQIRRNACPRHWSRKRSSSWMLRYYRSLNKIRHQ